MKKSLEQLKELLDQAMFGDPNERLNAEVSCTGMCYRHAEENEDVVASVKFFLEDHCGGGLTCDQCDVYRVLSAFVSDVELEADASRVIDDRIHMRINIKGLDENQLTEIYNGLQCYAEDLWESIQEAEEEGEKVGYQNTVRTVESIAELIKGYFK